MSGAGGDGGGGGGGGDGGGGGGANAPVIFALTPSQVNAGRIIAYETATGMKLYNAATAALPFKFDADAKGINMFCEKLKDRAIQSGWHLAGGNILSIPDSQGVDRDLITQYGQLTPDDIVAHVATYINAQGRAAQNAVQMHHCIMNSLSSEGNLKIVSEMERYFVNQVPVGPLLFKLLMQKAIVDTRATSTHLRENLTNLDSYITTVDSNIETFNQYVKVNRDGLLARGERTDDLMINLFKAYLTASDKAFVDYMKRKKDEYDDGADIGVEQIMGLALNKYKILSDAGEWNALTAEQQQIVALSSQLNKMRGENAKLGKKHKETNQGQGEEIQVQGSKREEKEEEEPGRLCLEEGASKGWRAKGEASSGLQA